MPTRILLAAGGHRGDEDARRRAGRVRARGDAGWGGQVSSGRRGRGGCGEASLPRHVPGLPPFLLEILPILRALLPFTDAVLIFVLAKLPFRNADAHKILPRVVPLMDATVTLCLWRCH
eukprot:1075155-Rhodomonas_salina.2